MPVNPNSQFKTMSLVLTKDQERRLKALAESRRTALRRVTVSDVARDVVEAGLGAILHAPHTTFETMNERTDGEEQVA